jgi:hypothetical protein
LGKTATAAASAAATASTATRASTAGGVEATAAGAAHAIAKSVLYTCSAESVQAHRVAAHAAAGTDCRHFRNAAGGASTSTGAAGATTASQPVAAELLIGAGHRSAAIAAAHHDVVAAQIRGRERIGGGFGQRLRTGFRGLYFRSLEAAAAPGLRLRSTTAAGGLRALCLLAAAAASGAYGRVAGRS